MLPSGLQLLLQHGSRKVRRRLPGRVELLGSLRSHHRLQAHPRPHALFAIDLHCSSGWLELGGMGQLDVPGSTSQLQWRLDQKGLWSASRSDLSLWQNPTGTHAHQLYTNVDETTAWTEDFSGDPWIFSPYQAGLVVRNPLHPYENDTPDTLSPSLSPHYHEGKAPCYECMGWITMAPTGFKVLAPVKQ